MTTQSPAPLPPELAGWRWIEQHYTSPASTEYALQSPDDDWATKVYARPDRAIAEAKRRVLSEPKTAPAAPPLISLDAIRTDGGTQARAGLDESTVAEYAEAWADLARQQNGLSKMPPIVVCYDGADYWLADGFHRLAAYQQFLAREPLSAAPRALAADVRPGTRRDAVLFACGANAAHGLRRTNADKRRAVETLLRDDEWRQWSDSEIARRCNVSHPFVADLRKRTGNVSSERKTADGRTMDTAGIGAANRERTAAHVQAAVAEQAAPPGNAPAPRVCARCGGPWGAAGSIVSDAGKLCQDCAPIYLETLAKTQAAVAGADRRQSMLAIPDAVRIPLAKLQARGWEVRTNGTEYRLRAPTGDTYATDADGVIETARLAAERPDATPDALMAAMNVIGDAPIGATPFWQSISPAHPTAHLWTQSGMYSYRSACGMTAQRAPSGSRDAGHCSSCVRATSAERAAPAVPHLPPPPEWKAAQQRAAAIGLWLDMNAHGKFSLLNNRGSGVDQIESFESALRHLEHQETAHAEQASEVARADYPDMEAMRAALDRAEQLGAVYDPLQQRADGRVPVLAPPDFVGNSSPPAYYDADELMKSCDLWEAWQRRWAEEAAPVPSTADDLMAHMDWYDGVETHTIRILDAAADYDRVGAIRAALALAASLAPSDLASIADQLSDAEYEALAALTRPVESEVRT